MSEFRPEEGGALVPTPHHDGFNRALERELRSRRDLSDGEVYEVRFRVRIRELPNPGYIVDGYIVELT